MGKNYVLSEENYMEVLNRLQKISNKYKLLSKTQTFKTDIRTKNENYSEKHKIHEDKSWGYRNEYNPTIDDFCDVKFSCSSFIDITEHPYMRLNKKHQENSLNFMLWKNSLKPLINIDLGDLCSISLYTEDKVFFDNNIFIVVTDNRSINLGKVSNVYKYYFIVDRKNKIFDLELEKTVRLNEWNHEQDIYEDMYYYDMYEDIDDSDCFD